MYEFAKVKSGVTLRMVDVLSEIIKDVVVDEDWSVEILRETFINQFPSFKDESDHHKKSIFNETLERLKNETNTFGRRLSVYVNQFHCIGGNDADLIYSFQCKDCGTIVYESHSFDSYVDMDLHCPVCNHVEDKTPFQFEKKGTISWIMEMKKASFNDKYSKKHGGSFEAGSYQGAKHKLTIVHRLYQFFFFKFKMYKNKKKYEGKFMIYDKKKGWITT